MNYYSLNKNAPSVDFKQATIKGQAPDKGLYFPEKIPVLDPALIKNIQQYSKEDLALEIMLPYVGNCINKVDLSSIVAVNLPVDWQKTKQKGKIIYNFNFHTEGFFFGWMWFKESTRIRNINLWYFKPSRSTSRLLSHYIKTDDKYQHLYREWKK